MFVASLYRVFGFRQLPVALAQTALFAVICLAVYATARRVTSEPVAVGAAAATALFPAIPYFGALVMTEVLTTLLFTISMWLALSALGERGLQRFAWLGLLLALTTLSRPVFVLFPFALAAVGFVLFPLFRVRVRPGVAQWGVMLATFALTMSPWFTYNYVTLGKIHAVPRRRRRPRTLGRLVAGDLVRDARRTSSRIWPTTSTIARSSIAASPTSPRASGYRSDRCSTTCISGRTSGCIWTAPTDPLQRALARVTADEEYRRVGIENIRRDAPAHLIKRLTRGLFILWAGEIPFRYSEINTLLAVDHSRVLGHSGARLRARARGRLRAAARRPRRRGPAAAGAHPVHLGGTFPAAHRGATVAAGAADTAPARHDRSRQPDRTLTSPRSADA